MKEEVQPAKTQQIKLFQNKLMTTLSTTAYNHLLFIEEWITLHQIMSALILVILWT